MGVLFSKVQLNADNGATEEFLCAGIPDCAEDLEDWVAYQDFLEDNLDAEFLDMEVQSYIYGDGETYMANEYEIAAYTQRGETFLSHPCVQQTQDSRFTVLLDVEENYEMEMI